MDVPLVNTFMGGDGAKNLDDNWEEALRVWPDIVAFADDHGRKITLENCPMLFSYDEWPGGHNIATTPRHVAPDPRAVGRHDRAQLRPVAPDPPDDRHPAVPQGVRAARPPLPGQGPDDRPRRALRAGHLLDGDRLADPAHPGPRRGRLGRRVHGELYRAGLRGRLHHRARGPPVRGHRREGQAGVPASPATSSGRTVTDDGDA